MTTDPDAGDGEALRSVLLSVAYDGRDFHGFARQPAQRTIAGELLGAIQAVDAGVRDVRGASRTDAGVHATDQRVAFDPTARLPPKGWVHAVNRHLPRAIAVRRAAHVSRGFTPRFESAGKRYRYVFLRDRVRDPFLDGRVLRVDALDDDALARMRHEAALAVGTHDFAAFRSSADERTVTTRTITRADIEIDPVDPRRVSFVVEGHAFMHNMVRILAGTLLDVGRGRLAPRAIARALASLDRRDAGITAPAAGLCLERAALRDEGQDAWPPVDD